MFTLLEEVTNKNSIVLSNYISLFACIFFMISFYITSVYLNYKNMKKRILKYQEKNNIPESELDNSILVRSPFLYFKKINMNLILAQKKAKKWKKISYISWILFILFMILVYAILLIV